MGPPYNFPASVDCLFSDLLWALAWPPANAPCVRDGHGCQGGSSAGSRAVYPPVPTGHVELGRCLGGPWQHRKQRGEQQALVSLCG